MDKKPRIYVSIINSANVMQLRALLNVSKTREKPYTQNDAITHLFEVLREHEKLKQENLELKNKLRQFEENG